MREKVILKFFLLMSVLSIISTAVAGTISIQGCNSSSGKAVVVYTLGGGNWLGFSAKTSSGKIIDIPPTKLSIYNFGSGTKTINFGANRGVTKVRASIWEGYDKGTNLMKGERKADTGWQSCN